MAQKRKLEGTSLSSKAHAFSVESLIGGCGEKRQHLDPDLDTLDLDVTDDAHALFSYEEAVQLLPTPESDSPLGSALSLTDSGLLDTPPLASDSEVKVELCYRELWDSFHTIGTEMIITKAGRRMFPVIRIRVTGLDPDAQYIVYLDVEAVDNNKYRYVYHSSQWMVAGTGETMTPRQKYLHPDSAQTGASWMKQVISFDKLKLTNHDRPKQNQITLHSMQKYQPRIHIVKKESAIEAKDLMNTSEGLTFTFPETSFMTVTAYQNQQITRLKIARNPFAKGFRDAGKSRSSLDMIMSSFGIPHNNATQTFTQPVFGESELARVSKAFDGFTPPISPTTRANPTYVPALPRQVPHTIHLAPNTFQVGQLTTTVPLPYVPRYPEPKLTNPLQWRCDNLSNTTMRNLSMQTGSTSMFDNRSAFSSFSSPNTNSYLPSPEYQPDTNTTTTTLPPMSSCFLPSSSLFDSQTSTFLDQLGFSDTLSQTLPFNQFNYDNLTSYSTCARQQYGS